MNTIAQNWQNWHRAVLDAYGGAGVNTIAQNWHRAVLDAERDLVAYFERWSRVHPAVPEAGGPSSRSRVAAFGGMPIRRRR